MANHNIISRNVYVNWSGCYLKLISEYTKEVFMQPSFTGNRQERKTERKNGICNTFYKVEYECSVTSMHCISTYSTFTQKHSPKCSVGHIRYFQKRGQNNYHILILFKWYTVRSGFGYITAVSVILRILGCSDCGFCSPKNTTLKK